MIEQLKADGDNRETVQDYFRKVGQLLPNEVVEELPLRFVPFSMKEMSSLVSCIANFESGGEAVRAFEPHWEPEKKPANRPDPEDDGSVDYEPKEDGASGEPWYGVIVPIPRKGQKRDAYLKNPDTIGSLYEQRHGQDEESQASRQRLWGFVNHFEPKPWVKKDGTQMPPSKTDVTFRESLDAFAEWFEQAHPDEKL